MNRDSDGEGLQPRPREWFAVLFGSRLFRENLSYANNFIREVTSISARQGLILRRTPFSSMIYEPNHENVEWLTDRIRQAIEGIQRMDQSLHMPFLIVINDQTLHDFYEDYLQPLFGESAFVYIHKAVQVQESLAVNSWEQIENDLDNIKEVMEEYNPLESISVESLVEYEASREDDYGNRSNGHYNRDEDYGRPRKEDEYGRQRREEDYGRQRRVVDRYEVPAPQQKPALTSETVAGALVTVHNHPTLLATLAEDMNRSVDFAGLEELPREPQDMLKLLTLFVLTTENMPPDQNARDKEKSVALRKKIAEQMLNSGLLSEVRTNFLEGLHPRLERAEQERARLGNLSPATVHELDMDGVYECIHLLLRAFRQLTHHNILNDYAFGVWALMEKPVFSLPGIFWQYHGHDRIQALCRVASEVTTMDSDIYYDSVRSILEEYLATHPRAEGSRDQGSSRDDGYSNRGREDYGSQSRQQGQTSSAHETASRSTSRYKYDPYDTDESDTTEVYDAEGNKDGYGSRDGNGYGNDRLQDGYGSASHDEGRDRRGRSEEYDDQSGYGREEEYDSRRMDEEYGRREEEERVREEGRRRQREEREAEQYREQARAAEQDRAFTERRHERAMQNMNRRGRGEDVPIFAWDECEFSAPPVSYRKLADRPVYDDLYRPKVPYMRRALLDGVYNDNEHYLDVQFRLMREDMVSPLRDGIYSLKLECGDGSPLTSNNETKIYSKVSVGALQVKGLDGLRMRVIQLPYHVLCTLRDDRQLKFGQCVVLSSDNFEREFHIGWIADRYQDEGQPWNGRLGVSFFDECEGGILRGGMTPIDKEKSYDMAEPSSYFEAYRHVLNVLRKMKKYTVFPFERYLVHMKRNTRLPLYMRAKESEEDQKEDKERHILYAKMIAEEQQKADEKKKKKKERASRSKSASAGEDEDTAEFVTTEEGADPSSLFDDGFNTDEEDAFLTGRGRTISHPNPRDLDTISIGDKLYNVAKLEEEFKSDSLDETQRKAVCYALTSELAIIQGPPGTGKTHIGVEIVAAIIENRIKWRMTEPILIVTFSNQALDHFLEKLNRKLERVEHPEAPKIVRLGSRSESEEIKRSCLLGDVMKEHEPELASANNNERKRTEMAKKRRAIGKLLNAVRIVRASRTEVMNFSALSQVMDPSHQMQIRQLGAGMRDSSGNPLNLDESLACWLLDKDYEKKRDMPGDDSDVDDFGARKTERRKPVSKVKSPLKGKETKKEKNERKRLEKRQRWRDDSDSSDSEESSSDAVAPPPVAEPAVEDGEEEEGNDDDDATLRAMLAKMNLIAESQKKSADQEERWRRSAEKYEVEVEWEEEKKLRRMGGGVTDDVEIFSKMQKQGMRSGKSDRLVCVDPNIVKDVAEQKQYILAKEALTATEVSTTRDVRTMPKELRWKLLIHWQDSLARAMRDSLDKLCIEYERACTRCEEAGDECRADVLRKALIVGATTTGSAKRRRLLAKIGPKVLIVEEAAEVLEAHLLASIVPSLQHAIFIGDHQQLRPSTAVHHLAKSANMEVSLFERLVKNNYPFHTLGLQHRMLTPLTEHVVRPYFYKMLADAPSVKEYPDVKGMATNLFFWSHNVPEDTVSDSMSKRNSVEAEMCRNLANYILMQGQYSAAEVTIIGMYGAQVTEIKRQLSCQGGPVRDVAVETVDSYQGKENRIMILSLVRSHSGGVGFLAIANRITVGLTRAQHGMYVIGNFEDIANYSGLWNDIVNSLNNAHLIDYAIPVVCQRHGYEQGIKINSDFQRLTPASGCQDICRYEMSCGHRCKATCHPPYQHENGLNCDANGQDYTCKEQCIKRCSKCDARCKRKCTQDCGSCHEVVTIELDCGHTVRCECGARTLARCKEPCSVVLDCGHACQNKCSVDCVTMEKCEQGTPYTHPQCGHKLVVPCNKINPRLGVAWPACYEPCPERLICGHKCPCKCGESCPTMCEQIVYFTGECGHQVEKKCSEDKNHIKCTRLTPSEMPKCSHLTQIECFKRKDQNECRSTCKQPTSCGHRCTLSCGACYKKFNAHECDARCTLQLPCGHGCQGQCGRPCKCMASCRTRCSHQRCGSVSTNTKGGPLTYSRDCSDPCVLCVESCDNHCEHRSCSKKCFEACDVPPCNRPCQKLLRCNHSCLGLCGEICPALCGSCDTLKYKTLLEQSKLPPIDEETKELHRLIQMPECSHIFPYKLMDEEVRKQIAAGEIVLKCPRCSKMIDECRRYVRQQKRLWLESDSMKWEKRMNEESWSRAELANEYKKLRALMIERQDEVVKFQRGSSKREATGKFSNDVFRMADALHTYLRIELDKASERSEYYYWKSVVSCHRSICGLVLDYLMEGDRFKIQPAYEQQPNLRFILDEVFDRKRARMFKMKDQFQEMTSIVQQSMRDRRPGALVPIFTASLLKNILYLHMERLNTLLRSTFNSAGDPSDLTKDTAAMLRRVAKSIKDDNPDKLPARNIEDMVARLNVDVYTKQLQMGPPFAKAFRVDLPEF